MTESLNIVWRKITDGLNAGWCSVALAIKGEPFFLIFFFPVALYNGFISAQNGMEKYPYLKKGATLLENKV